MLPWLHIASGSLVVGPPIRSGSFAGSGQVGQCAVVSGSICSASIGGSSIRFPSRTETANEDVRFQSQPEQPQKKQETWRDRPSML